MGLASEDCKNALTMIKTQLQNDLGPNIRIEAYEETLLLSAQLEKTGCAYGISARSSSLVYSRDITNICYREGYWTCSGFEFASSFILST